MFGDEVSFLRQRHTYPDIVESTRTFFFPDIACSRLRHSRVHGIEKTRTRQKKNRRNSLFSRPALFFARVSHSRLPHSFAPSPPSERLERAIPDTVSVHTNPAYESATCESALQSGIFLIRYESGIVWTLNPYVFYPVK